MAKYNYPPISANTLFHFTKTFEDLLNILENEFRPHYCLENYNLLLSGSMAEDPVYEWALPMVCFCDLPLTLIRANHLRHYGHYGIGMTKDWGIKNRISPVVYTYKESLLANSLQWIFTVTRGQDGDRVTANMNKLLCFIKPYVGNLYRRNKTIKGVRFYNEREWRFVPQINSASGVDGLEKDEFLDPEKVSAANTAIGKISVPFEPNDIKYLIVKKQADIMPLIKKITEIKEKYSATDIAVLKSRILTTTQLSEDF